MIKAIILRNLMLKGVTSLRCSCEAHSRVNGISIGLIEGMLVKTASTSVINAPTRTGFYIQFMFEYNV
jgi:hypothetical protein